MSQLKSKPVKVHSKVSSEKLSSDSQASKQKTKSLKRQHTSNRPLRKVSPQRNGKHESSINGVDSVEDLSSKVEIAKINLKTLQKIDAGIARIVSTVPHVELYQYKSDENMWVSYGVHMVSHFNCWHNVGCACLPYFFAEVSIFMSNCVM